LRCASHDANGDIELTLKKGAMLIAQSMIAKGFAMNEKLMLYSLNYSNVKQCKFCLGHQTQKMSGNAKRRHSSFGF
jgi:hypothetical protein